MMKNRFEKYRIKLLKITGFNNYEFYNPVNGQYNKNDIDDMIQVKNALDGTQNYNIFIASQEGTFFDKRKLNSETGAKVLFLEGFFNEERNQDGSIFCWSGIRSRFMMFNVKDIELELSIEHVSHPHRNHTIYIYKDDNQIEQVILTPEKPKQIIPFDIDNDISELTFQSNSCFCPAWFGSDDHRFLSFTLCVKSLK